jgi:hypothetical protein
MSLKAWAILSGEQGPSYTGHELQQPFSNTPKYTLGLDVLGAVSRTLIANSYFRGERLSIFIQNQDTKSTPTGKPLFNEWYQHNQLFVISGMTLREWIEEVDYINIDAHVSEAVKERYVNKLSIHGRNWRLIITSKGYLGTGVNTCIKGDLVCVLFGCSTPVSIRMDCEHYLFLGETYLHGVMDGEAIDGLERGDFKKQSFCIW